MIGYLRGKVTEVLETTAIIDVAGVGYKVEIPQGHFLENDDVELYIHTALRENDLSLWGFPSRTDLRMFTLLLGVNGVGLRTAQTLIFTLGINKIINAVSNNSPADLKVTGVGKKTSEKIIIDLRDKIEGQGFVADTDTGNVAMSESSKIVEEAVQAIERLGYKRAEIVPVVEQIDISKHSDSESLLKAILTHI